MGYPYREFQHGYRLGFVAGTWNCVKHSRADYGCLHYPLNPCMFVRSSSRVATFQKPQIVNPGPEEQHAAVFHCVVGRPFFHKKCFGAPNLVNQCG